MRRLAGHEPSAQDEAHWLRSLDFGHRPRVAQMAFRARNACGEGKTSTGKRRKLATWLNAQQKILHGSEPAKLHSL